MEKDIKNTITDIKLSIRHLATLGVPTKQLIDATKAIEEELAESEDEKIRKELIDYFKENNAALAFRCISNECVIAWLEKQGESTEINPSEFDLRLNKLLKQFESLPKVDLIGILSFYLNVIQNDGIYKEEKQGKQKHQYKSRPRYVGETELLGWQNHTDKVETKFKKE